MNVHPVALLLASNALLTTTAAYTERGSILRYVVLMPALIISFLMVQSLSVRTTGWMGQTLGGPAFWFIVNFCNKLLLKGWDYDQYGPSARKNSSKKQTTAGNVKEFPPRYPGTRTEFGNEVTGASRGVGKFWEVRNVPRFAETDPTFVPSQRAFVLRNTIVPILCYFIHNYTAELILNLKKQHLESSNVPLWTRMSDITFEELEVRVISTLGWWITLYTMLRFFHGAASAVSALFNPNDIKLWRPMFGSIGHAYTVRNFWGKFWHQMMRHEVEGTSNFAAHDVLHLPQKGLLQRYAKIFFCFALSGILHTFCDGGAGIPLRRSGALQFFTMQAVGIILEDTVQGLYKRYLRTSLGSMARYIERAIGYAWVTFFLVWTCPIWVYPNFRDRRREDSMLSFEAVKPALFGRPISH